MQNENLSKFMSKTYGYMFLALLITGVGILATIRLVGVLMISLPAILAVIAVQFLLIFLIGRQVNDEHASMAKSLTLLIGFALLEGVILSPIIALTSITTLTMALTSTVVLFAVLAIFGLTTKRDLSKFGSVLTSLLITLIIVSIIGLFFVNVPMVSLVISYISIIIFSGFVLYDNKMLKDRYQNSNGENLDAVAVSGALNLYLDFINLFIDFIRIFTSWDN
jgi:Integral membrane protein, interacts with FtsH